MLIKTLTGEVRYRPYKGGVLLQVQEHVSGYPPEDIENHGIDRVQWRDATEDDLRNPALDRLRRVA